MKDFVSRLTFGFLMAQLFPGAVTVFAITFAYLTFEGRLPNGVMASVDVILNTWESGAAAHKLFLAGLFIAFGMLIHGLHWTTLGMLEQEWERVKKEWRGPRAEMPDSMFDLPRDRRHLAVLLLVGPVRLLRDLCAVGARRGVVCTAIRENVARITENRMKQHEFMQDFYLHTAQFFAHTAHALVFCALALLAYALRFDAAHGLTYGFTGRRVALLLLLYTTASAFFILSRVQLATLFRAEQDLIAKSEGRRLRRWPPLMRVRRGRARATP